MEPQRSNGAAGSSGPHPVLLGSGSYLPGDPVTNDELGRAFGREVVYLAEMLGARTRHLAIDLGSRRRRAELSNARMASAAGRSALDDAGIGAADVDLLILATCTPDYAFPATALFVQEELGAQGCCVMELRAGCGGMAQAFMIARHMIRAGTTRRALLIGSDLISPFVSVLDGDRARTKDLLVSLAMFGDGAGAAVLGVGDAGPQVVEARSWSLSCGRPPGMLLRTGGALDAGGRDSSPDGSFVHDFNAVLHHGPDLIRAACGWLQDEAGYDLRDVAYFIPPQVSGRSMAAVAAEFGVAPGTVVSDFARVGNTVSAAIYVALDRLRAEGGLQRGQRLVLLPAEATKWLTGAVVLDWQ